MTTKPKAKRFRIRRNNAAAEARAPQAPSAEAVAAKASPRAASAAAADEDGFGQEPFPTARKAAPPPSDRPKPEATQPTDKRSEARAGTELEAIRNEGLTARQLRMARRLAHKHGLAPADDFDAVRLLRKAGIDPFERANMLELVVAEPDGKAAPSEIPAPKTGTEVSTEVADPAARRAKEIRQMQRDIARRRRIRIIGLMARLSVFVVIPTVLVGWYFFFLATPMYATKSEFVIQQADSGGAAGMGGLFAGTGMATSQDSITVQSYLGSREAMLRLDEDLGFKAHFSGDNIDPWQRLDAEATNEAAYRLYQKHVKIGYDPTEGIIRMEVIAADPSISADFSKALIGYAEEQVDQLTQRLRDDQMEGANAVFAEAEEKMVEAQQRVLELQEQLGVLDPASETSSLMGQISTFETQVAEKRLQLEQLLDNPVPNAARVSGTEGDIARLNSLIADLRSQLTESNSGERSLARVSGELRMAEVDLETRTLMMQEALQSRESSRIEAERQARYLSSGVNPVPPDEATYPRAFENTLLAALIFSGIYLMISITASILREQVSG